MYLIFNMQIQYIYFDFYLCVFNKYKFCKFVKYIFCVPFKYVYNYLLNTYIIAAREKYQILKNGSDYQGAWPLLYIYNSFNKLRYKTLGWVTYVNCILCQDIAFISFVYSKFLYACVWCDILLEKVSDLWQPINHKNRSSENRI